MDPDKLAERDRARRQRQVQSAKMQGLALISCVVIGLAVALLMYFGSDKKSKSRKDEKEKLPPISTPAAKEETPPVSMPAPKEAAAPDVKDTKPAAEQPAVSAPAPLPPASTIKQNSSAMVGLSSQGVNPAITMANVLESIGVPGGKEMYRSLPKVEEARRVLELLGKSSLISGKLEYVINKPGIELRMKKFYEESGLKEPDVGEQMADFAIEMAGERYLDVVYKNPTQPSGTVRASFLRDEKGIVRLDWESFTGFSAMGMREFRKNKPEVPVTMRVYASVDDYHNYEFSDAKKYLSVRLRNADGSDAINGYCELGGRMATIINARLAAASAADSASGSRNPGQRRTWTPIVVKVRFPAKPQSDHCVELMDLMYGQWLVPAGLLD